MPPLRGGRASKACETCRKLKSRCWPSDSARGTCLRCETLSQPCSLEYTSTYSTPASGTQRYRKRATPDTPGSGAAVSVDERLQRLEGTVAALVNRLDSSNGDSTSPPSNPPPPPPRVSAPTSREEQDQAPVLLIRDAANDAGVHSPDQVQGHPKQHLDVISAGLVSLSTAHSLLSLFHIHYGRWVKFTDDISTETLLLQVRRSPLLLCSILLIAVRHTEQELADRLAPTLFEEAKRLVASSLLVVPQTIEFFQAALVLSLWSTTIGQVPLSIDSWLLTGYALQQCLASPLFNEVLQADSPRAVNHRHHSALCIWNHLCIAHLQYCVGTRRQALLNQSQVDRCLRILDTDNVTNFEARMVAEVKLYWIVYEKCCGSQVNVADTKAALKTWQEVWVALFDQPRAQFLQMGFHFAHLLAYCQSLKSARAVMRSSILAEMIDRSRSIINIAIDTTDERTRHLTDHIYHTITFSALTLCRLVHTYESKLRAANHDIYALDSLVLRLVGWLRSIGLPCHAAHILGDVVSSQFKKLRPNFQPEPVYGTNSTPNRSHEGTIIDHPTLPLPEDVAFQFPDFIGSELFDLNDDSAWPQWDMLMSDTDIRASLFFRKVPRPVRRPYKTKKEGRDLSSILSGNSNHLLPVTGALANGRTGSPVLVVETCKDFLCPMLESFMLGIADASVNEAGDEIPMVRHIKAAAQNIRKEMNEVRSFFDTGEWTINKTIWTSGLIASLGLEHLEKSSLPDMKPTAQLCARLRFTTKQVGRGFYRGNRTGSKGAHTGFGGYVIDWRKTSHYNVPDMQGFSLTPFVTLEMEPTSRVRDLDGTLYTPEKVDGLEFLRDWKRLNPEEYDHIYNYQEDKRIQEQEALHPPADSQKDISPEEKQAEPKTPYP